jgi:hypothetical protein
VYSLPPPRVLSRGFRGNVPQHSLIATNGYIHYGSPPLIYTNDTILVSFVKKNFIVYCILHRNTLFLDHFWKQKQGNYVFC